MRIIFIYISIDTVYLFGLFLYTSEMQLSSTLHAEAIILSFGKKNVAYLSTYVYSFLNNYAAFIILNT